jgi:micrococcal nuclease
MSALGTLVAPLAVLTLAGCTLPHDVSEHGGGDGRSARVVGVTDGDTIELTRLGRVRLIGVDTPEVYGGVECFGRAASSFTKRHLPPGTRVRYRIGVEERDRYGRVLAYVWLPDGRMFNELLVAEGYATPLTIPPNVEYEDVFVKAARRARESQRGLWASAACAKQNEQDTSGGGCAGFDTQPEAQRWWTANGRPGQYDGDGDDRVCEELPAG